MIARHLLIHGRVQGVGYRYGLEVTAARLRLVGWVRNRLDGTVEAEVQGEPAAVDALIIWAHRGPTAARVTQVDVQPASLVSHSGFVRLPTV